MVWANVSQNSGLVNFIPKSCLPQIKSVLFLLPKNGRESLELVSKIGFIKSMEQKFPFGTFRLEKQDYLFTSSAKFRCSWIFSTVTTYKAMYKWKQQLPTLLGVVVSVPRCAHTLAFDRIKTFLGPFARGLKLCQ